MVLSEQRPAQRRLSARRRGREGALQRPRQRDLVDVERGVDLASDAFKGEERADQQDDVRGRVHLPIEAHVAQDDRHRTKARAASRACVHAIAELVGHHLPRVPTGWVRHLPRIRLLGAPFDRIAHEARVHERLGEPNVILREHALDARGERLHDLRLHARHEPKVEEDEPPVVREHDVPLVRVSMHQPSEHEPSGHCFARHVRHPHRLLRA